MSPVFGPHMSADNNMLGICQELFKESTSGLKLNFGIKIAEGIIPATIMSIRLAKAPL